MTLRIRRASRWVLALATVLALTATARPQEGGPTNPKVTEDRQLLPVTVPALLQAQCIGGSLVRLTMLDDQLRLKTRYGELLIPAAEIRQIEFAMRLPDDVAKRIEKAISNLDAPEFRVREAAGVELLALEERAYQALLLAANDKSPEVKRRAEQLLEKLRETIAEERLVARKYDLIYTDDSKIAGLIDAESLQVHTAEFGDQHLKLSDLRSVRTPETAEQEPKDVRPDPGDLTSFQGEVGKRFAFRVTGGAPPAQLGFPPGFGFVWGTDVYTLDSTLAFAAVHAGVLRAGETGVVRVSIEGPQASYAGSSRNGVNSDDWGFFPASYRFKTKR